jgi:hypothetical protein
MKMNYLISICLFFLVINSIAFSQKKGGPVRHIGVKSDKNIVPDTKPDFAISRSDQCYIIDGNESKGYVELEFEVEGVSKAPQTITLVTNCADVEYAESAEGFSVFLDSQKLGSITQLYRNAAVEVPLDVNFLKSTKKFTLSLKANGEDGLYLLSKKSGFEPFLLITY